MGRSALLAALSGAGIALLLAAANVRPFSGQWWLAAIGATLLSAVLTVPEEHK